MNMIVSVAMCTYNGARYLPAQLSSIADQTHPPNEVVICDDRSTDGTAEILREFSSSAKMPVRIVSNERTLGSTKNFEKAISLCKGEIIALADQDDIWRPGKLKTVVSLFAANSDAGYVFSDGEVIDENDDDLGISMWRSLGFSPDRLVRRFRAYEIELLLKQNCVTGAAMAFRSSLRAVILPIPSDWVHDYWIALLGSTFMYGLPVSDLSIQYRQHPDQQKGVRSRSITEMYEESALTTSRQCELKVEKLRELESRIANFVDLSPKAAIALRTIGEKIDHTAKRAATRSSKGLSKAKTIMAETLAGRYHRFSRSWFSIIRDLLSLTIIS